MDSLSTEWEALDIGVAERWHMKQHAVVAAFDRSGELLPYEALDCPHERRSRSDDPVSPCP